MLGRTTISIRNLLILVSAVVFVFLILYGSATAGPLDVDVISYEELDVSGINEAVDAAVEKGVDWPKDAVKTVLYIVCGDVSAFEIAIMAKANRVENPDSVVVEVARDSFADDSVRGDWHRAVLLRQVDGTWRFKRVFRAFRCYRGKSKDGYSSDLCN